MSQFRTTPTGSRACAVLRAVARAAAIAGVSAMLAGCYSVRENDRAAYANDYRERHPITMKEGQRTVEIFLGRNRGGLSPLQRADVMAFASSWRRESTGGIVIEVPANGPTRQAAEDSLREIHSIFAANAVPQHGVVVRSYAPSPYALTSIKLIYPKLVAEAGPCGLWPNDLGPADDRTYVENKPYWNLGCAHQRNLASMIDNPADLVQPRGETAVHAGRRSIALEKYRKGEDPSAAYKGDASGFDTGKISGLGK